MIMIVASDPPDHGEHTHLMLCSPYSLEGLSPLENPRQQWRNIDNSLVGACGGGSPELDPDTLMKEASPMHSQDEGFPLIHSQSNLETIQPCDIGGVTGVGPELRAVEDMRVSFKRQLSVPSNNETLQKVNDVRRYLQVSWCVLLSLYSYPSVYVIVSFSFHFNLLSLPFLYLSQEFYLLLLFMSVE